MMVVASSARADEPKTHVYWQYDHDAMEGGVITFAGFYVLSSLSSSIGQAVCNGSCTDHSYLWLLLPFAGPAIAAATPAVVQLSPAWSVLLVADSVGQVAGGLVWLVARLVPTKRVVVVEQEHARLRVEPGAPGASLGLTFSAAF